MRANPTETCQCDGCKLQVPAGLQREGLCLDHYLDLAFQKLCETTAQLRRGENADLGGIDWLLAQVDFVVDSLAENDREQEAEQRTRLLELLLGIVNLNEYVMHSAVPIRRSV